MDLKNYFQRAKNEHWAIPHFNFSTLEIAKAIAVAAKNAHAPVMMGLSEGEQKYVGIAEGLAMVRGLAKDTGATLFVNADHHKSFESVKQCIDIGFDSVHFDGSELTLEKNIEETKKIVTYKNSVNPTIMVEAEVGYLVGSSKILEGPIEIKEEYLTKPEIAQRFVTETGVDRLAVSVGNIHGIPVSGKPKLRFDLIEAIAKAVPEVYLVLHGGSGTSDDDFKKAIQLGMTNVHINTEIRQLWRETLDKELRDKPKEVVPYVFGEAEVVKLTRLIEQKIEVFGAQNRL